MITKWVSIEIHCDEEDCDNVFTWGADDYLSKKETIKVATSTQGWRVSKNYHECPSCIEKKRLAELDLVADEFYLIDKDRSLYKSVKDDGIYYRGPGGKAWSRRNARSQYDNSAWDGPPIAYSKNKR